MLGIFIMFDFQVWCLCLVLFECNCWMCLKQFGLILVGQWLLKQDELKLCSVGLFLFIVVFMFFRFWQISQLQFRWVLIFFIVWLCVISFLVVGMLMLQMFGQCIGGVVLVRQILCVLVLWVICMICWLVVLCMIELFISSIMWLWNFRWIGLSLWCIDFMCLFCFGMMKVWLMQWFLMKFLWYFILSILEIFSVVLCEVFGIGMMVLMLWFGCRCRIFLFSLMFMCMCVLCIEMLLIIEFGCVKYMYLKMYGVCLVGLVQIFENSLLCVVIISVLFGCMLCMCWKFSMFSVVDLDVMMYLLFFVWLCLFSISGWMLCGLWKVIRFRFSIMLIIVQLFLQWWCMLVIVWIVVFGLSWCCCFSLQVNMFNSILLFELVLML